MVEIVKAYVVATVKRGTEHDAAQKIRKIAEVTETLVTYGLYDVVVRIEAKSLGIWTRLARTCGKWRRLSRPARLWAPSKETA